MSDAINVGILGAGWFGRGAHLANLLRMADVNVVAASSRSQDSLRQVDEMADGRLRLFDDWRKVLEINDIDAVIIALTNDQHHASCISSLEAGKHVFCEKPLGLTIPQCDSAIAAAEVSGRVLQVGHEMRYQRLYQRMKQMVEEGLVGQMQLAWCREFRGPMRPGWRSSEQRTGGALVEKNCHHFDLFNWLLETPPVRVAAMGGRDVLLDREILDNALVIVEHDGGRRAVVELCLFAPFGSEIEIGLAGSKGRIDTLNQVQRLVCQRFDKDERTELEVPDAEEEAGFVDAAGHVNRGVYTELREFIVSCRTGSRPLVDGGAGRMSVAVCLAAQESIHRKEMVTIEEILAKSGS